MPQVIWKHRLEGNNSKVHSGIIVFTVPAPSGASFITAAHQPDIFGDKGICVWEVHNVSGNEKIMDHKIAMVGTGWEIPDDVLIAHNRSGIFATIHDAGMVWHFAEVAIVSEPDGYM